MEQQVEESAGVFAAAFDGFSQSLISGVDELLPCVTVPPDYEHVLLVDGSDSEKLKEMLQATCDSRPEGLGRIVVIGTGGKSNALNEAISNFIAKALGNDDILSLEPAWPQTMSLSFFRSYYQPDFRWSDLHHHLSEQGTKTKLERQQQRRKALHKFHEAKRLKKIKKAREHAKQKQKSMKRYA
jgi:hypothetical protein